MATLRSVDGDFIAGAALLSCCVGAVVSAVLCEVVDVIVVDAIVVAGAGAGAGNFMEGARLAPTRSNTAKVASGICAIM